MHKNYYIGENYLFQQLQELLLRQDGDVQLLVLTTVIGVLQYRKMSGGTEFLSGYSAALQKMSAATVEYVRGMQIIKIFGVTVQYYKTLINSIKEYKQYVYQYSLSCKNPYVGFQVLFNVFYAFAVPAAVVFISYGEPAMLILAKIVFFAVFSAPTKRSWPIPSSSK